MKVCSKCKQQKTEQEFPFVGKLDRRLRKSCKTCHAIANKAYRARNVDKLTEVRKVWLFKNENYMKQYYKEYAAKNREHKNQYYVERRKTDFNFRLAYLLRGRLRVALKKGAKTGSAVHDLGCTITEFKAHIEKQWTLGMTWENYGKGKGRWNIDHIIPLISFDLSNIDEVKKACHFSNLQPLWSDENIRKGAKLDIKTHECFQSLPRD